MAGQRLDTGAGPIFIDYHDGEGSAVVNGREWRWEFHHYCGPQFLRKDGEPLVHQPTDEHHPVWQAFEAWHKRYRQARESAEPHEIVCV